MSSAPTLSKAQFLKMGSEICRRGNDRMTAAYGRWERANTVDGKRPPEAVRDKVLGQIVPSSGRMRSGACALWASPAKESSS